MPSFKQLKTRIRAWLASPDWPDWPDWPDSAADQEFLPKDLLELDPKKLLSPLLACLPEQEISERAAQVFGWALNRVYARNPEAAREVMRRLIWQMNEESGNIAWGVPMAFAQALAQNRALANDYHRILFHYIFDKPGDSTYCDFAPLRQDCYQAVATVLQARPDLAPLALPLLQDSARRDLDPACRAKAAACLTLAESLSIAKPAP